MSSGSICFDFDGKNLRADKGDIVYIPYDAAYLSEWQDEHDIDYITTEFILCDLNTAQKSEKIVGPFAIPTCIDDGMDDDEILDEDGEENEEI